MTTRREVLALSLPAALLAGCGGGGGGSGVPAPSPGPAPGPGPAPAPVPAPGPSPAPAGVPFPAPGPVVAPSWAGFAGNAQHQAQSAISPKPLTRVVWTAPVDLAPPYTAGGSLLVHYGSPVITAANTVLVPVKTTDAGGFRVEARRGSDGVLLWQQTTAYLLPSRPDIGSAWTPSFNIALDGRSRLYVPESGGRLLLRDDVDQVGGAVYRLAFYGNATYDANATALDVAIKINTPLTVDAAGNVFFGFMAAAGNPAGLSSGIARIGADGVGSWKGAADLAGDAGIVKVSMNAAPALSLDGSTLYVAVNNGSTSPSGYLLALNSTTLALKAKQTLRSPVPPRQAAVLHDSSTASPLVAPDGDVYYGVHDRSTGSHNGRGWLLHFDAALTTEKTPGSFGWDNTPSIVPVSMVNAPAEGATYFLLSKYNNYYGAGTGDGQNRMALLNPMQLQDDPVVGGATQVMKEVFTILGPTLDGGAAGGAGAVREWCVNTAVVLTSSNAVMMNNEDGILYRWDLQTNTFSQHAVLNEGIGQAYTATLVGPDGMVYAINNATLNAVGA